MAKTWQLQEAKNKLSELVDQAILQGPQQITRRGKAAAVVVSSKDYEKLKRGKETLVEFFRRCPLKGLEFDRAKDLPRDIQL